ncbi:MAG: WYL domain-containing protein [Aeromicrobium sp.]|uniref:helix-turn-helix transcriptional regulator n=1 Tax=Aeromicrobium sp. TaxID=1871063 RepID=UPI0039E33989
MKPSSRDVRRRLALIPYLRGKQGVAVDEVAREFGVAPKVIRRDVEQITMTGVGAYGGDLIDVDYLAFENDDRIHLSNADVLTRPLRINGGEAAALIVALRALRDVAEPGQAAVVDSALDKLHRAAGERPAEAVDVVVTPVAPAIRAAVTEAFERDRRLEIVYATASRDALTTRQVDPIATFSRDGHDYLEAWCHRAGGERFFRLDRMDTATVLDTPRERAAEGRGAQDGFFADDALRAVLDVEPPARWIVEYYDAEILDDAGPTWRVRLPATDETWISRLALRSGGAVRIVEPAAARSLAAERAAAALGAYHDTEQATEES